MYVLWLIIRPNLKLLKIFMQACRNYCFQIQISAKLRTLHLLCSRFKFLQLSSRYWRVSAVYVTEYLVKGICLSNQDIGMNKCITLRTLQTYTQHSVQYNYGTIIHAVSNIISSRNNHVVICKIQKNQQTRQSYVPTRQRNASIL